MNSIIPLFRNSVFQVLIPSQVNFWNAVTSFPHSWQFRHSLYISNRHKTLQKGYNIVQFCCQKNRSYLSVYSCTLTYIVTNVAAILLIVNHNYFFRGCI